jgi:hypothetical protein
MKSKGEDRMSLRNESKKELVVHTEAKQALVWKLDIK